MVEKARELGYVPLRGCYLGGRASPPPTVVLLAEGETHGQFQPPIRFALLSGCSYGHADPLSAKGSDQQRHTHVSGHWASKRKITHRSDVFELLRQFKQGSMAATLLSCGRATQWSGPAGQLQLCTAAHAYARNLPKELAQSLSGNQPGKAALCQV
jgi:hypothetical protein